MSADPFAAFGSFVQSSQKPESQQSTSKTYPAANSAVDPFSLFTPATPSPAQTAAPTQPPALVQQAQPFQTWPTASQQQQQQQQPSGGNTSAADIDIWGEFTSKVAQGGQPTQSSGNNRTVPTADDDDGWGDFEVAGPSPAPPTAAAATQPEPGPSRHPAAVHPRPNATGNPAPKSTAPMTTTMMARSQPQPPRRTRVTRASTLDLFNYNFSDLPEISSSSTALKLYTERSLWEADEPALRTVAPRRAPAKPKNTDPNVLFDADDYDGEELIEDDDNDDDFGDFESVTASPPPKPALATGPAPAPAPAFDLLDFASPAPAPAPTPAAPPSTTNTAKKEPPGKLLSIMNMYNLQQQPQSPGAYPQPPKSPSFQERNPFPSLSVKTPNTEDFPQDVTGLSNGKPKSASPVTAWPALGGDGHEQPAHIGPYKDDEEEDGAAAWGAFGDSPSPEEGKGNGVAEKAAAAAFVASHATSPGWDWDVADGLVPATATKLQVHVAKTAVVAPRAKAAPSHPPPVPTAVKKTPKSVSTTTSSTAATATAATTTATNAAATTSATSAAATAAAKKKNAIPEPPPKESWDWDALDPAPMDRQPPPTNVPPPSVLLSLFPALLSLPVEGLFRPTQGRAAQAPAAVRSRVASDPAVAAFLVAYLSLASVAARILAGRRSRWRRDKLLAQGMAVGPAAAAGKGGGMKIAGLDRAQAAREEREAADVVEAWRGVVGRLRGFVAGANSSSSGAGKTLRVPEIVERPPVQTAKGDGVLTSPKPCVVCGLMRDERVGGVDADVEDRVGDCGVGEWWVDGWGHRACRNFWLEHEITLRSR